MNRRSFLGSGLASLFVGIFALLMGGGLPRPKAREGKAVRFDNSPLSAKDQAYAESLDLTAATATLGITPAPDELRILKPWDGKSLQEADYCGPIGPYGGTGYIEVETFPNGLTNEEIEKRTAKLADMMGQSVPWDAPTKATPLADMRRIRKAINEVDLTTPGRQFGLG